MGKLTRLIGDIHGEWELYHQTATDAINFGGCERTIQVGDFGVGFSGPYWHDRADEFHWDGTHRFIRGNHDDPARCRKMAGWIQDGLIEDDVMFIGGAWSIDHAHRTEGVLGRSIMHIVLKVSLGGQMKSCRWNNSIV